MKKIITLLLVLVGGVLQIFGWGNVYINSKDNNWGDGNASYSTQLTVAQSNHYYIVLQSSNLTWESGYYYFRFWANYDDNGGTNIGANDTNPIITSAGYTNIGQNTNTFRLAKDENVTQILINLDYYNGGWHLHAFKDTKYTISFLKPEGWYTPTAHIWNYNYDCDTWPGTILTSDADNTSIYTATIDGFENAEVIFSNNGNSELTKTDVVNNGVYQKVADGNNDGKDDAQLYGIKTKITSVGYATFSSTKAVDFSSESTIEACKASVETGGHIAYSKVTYVAAGEGALLRRADGTIASAASVIPLHANQSVSANGNNDFVGITTKQNLPQRANGKTNYILTKRTTTSSDAPLGFYKVNASGSWCNAGTAYLATANSPSPARGYFPVWEETTSVESIHNETEFTNLPVYDLQGRHVVNPQKGLYIVNGKKVIK